MNELYGLLLFANCLLPVAARAQREGVVPLPATVTTLAGDRAGKDSRDGLGAMAHFSWPMGIAVDASNSVYVADEEGNCIRKITAAGQVTTLAGRPGTKHESLDGPGSNARFYHPVGIAADGRGNLYVTDADNHTIRKITPLGEVTTLAGLAGRKGHADGGPGTARFNLPHGVAVAADGTVYIADT